jgi:hypothetical protein
MDANHITVARRFAIYLLIWIVAAIAVQAWLQPDSLTETNLTPIQQRIRWPLLTPVFAVLGLAHAIGGTRTAWPFITVVACFVTLAILALCCSRRAAFSALMFIHAVVLAIAIAYFVQFSRLPSGG